MSADYIHEIYDEFRHHTNSLYGLQQNAITAIDNWETGLKNQIEEHAREQRRLVDDAYRVRRKHADDMRGQFVETCGVYRINNNAEEIKRLLKQCKNVRVELVNLNFRSVNQEFINVKVIEPSEQMDQEDISSTENTANRFPTRSIVGVINPVHNNDFNSSSRSTSTTSASDETNQRLTTQSAYNHNHSTDVNVNNPTTNFNDDSSPIDKCPTCYMIFPSSMLEIGRRMHVEDHYRD